MPDPITACLSVLSLTVSAITAWLTLFRGGTVKMTQPTVVFLGPDSGGDRAKIYLRTLLYATSKRGRIIEGMYAKVRSGESTQNFNVWVYGERDLARGSGLFVGESGVTYNHHFLLPKNATFTFSHTEYVIEVYANLVGSHGPHLLHRLTLAMPPEHAVQMRDSMAGVFFDWGPDSDRYHPHVKPRPGTDVNLIADELARRMGFPPEPEP